MENNPFLPEPKIEKSQPASRSIHFDLTTLLAFTTVYVLLFGLLAWLNASTTAFVYLIGLFTFVLFAQLLTFGAMDANTASMIGGAAFAVTCFVVSLFFRSSASLAMYSVGSLLGSIFFGAIQGLFCGLLVRAILLIVAIGQIPFQGRGRSDEANPKEMDSSPWGDRITDERNAT